MRNILLTAYNSNYCPQIWCMSHQQASGAVENTVYSTSRLKQTGKSSLWMANCALFRCRRWLSLRRWMKLVCTPSIINTTMKTPYLLTTYSFKAGWHSPPSNVARGPNPGVDAICGLSLLLVLSFTLRGFFPVHLVFPSPQAPTLPNFNSFWNEQTRLNEFLRASKSVVGKQITFRPQRRIRIFSVFNHYFSP